MGNLKNPPLFLRPSVVRSLVSNLDALAKGVNQVPIAPIKLVDVPRRSEDPRLAKANDDSHDVTEPSGWVAPPVASEPEDWPDAPLPDHADPDLDRPEPSDDGEAVSTAPAKRVRKSRATGVKAAAEAARAERNEHLLAAMRAGESVEALAERFGLSAWTVREVGYAHGIKRCTGPKKSPEIAERNRQVVQAFAAGEPVAEIMARFGVNRASVYQIARKADFKRPVEDHTARNEALLAAYAAGDEMSEISGRFGLKIQSIYQIANQAGVKRPIKERAPRPARIEKVKLERAPKPPKAPRVPKPKKIKIAATRPFHVDRAGDAAQAPEGSSAGVDGGHRDRANACEQPTKSTRTADFYSEVAIKRRLQNAGRARSLAENSEAKAQRMARRAERVAAEEAAAAEFAAALDRVRARRESGVEIVVPKPAAPVNSGLKLAEAIRRRDAAKASAAKSAARPLERAPSREECPRCGVPGWKVCDHQLPCAEGPPPAPIETVDLRRVAKFTGSRQGISVLRIK